MLWRPVEGLPLERISAVAANYDINDQVEIMDIGRDGSPVRSMSITFTTKPSGITSSVRIPISSYSAAEVDKEVSAFAIKLEEAHQL